MTRPDECSREVLDTIPLVMQTIRSEVRRQRRSDLSVPQFRTLAFVFRNAGRIAGRWPSLSAWACLPCPGSWMGWSSAA